MSDQKARVTTSRRTVNMLDVHDLELPSWATSDVCEDVVVHRWGRGFRVTGLVRDLDAACFNPREDVDVNMLWVGLPHCRYEFGEEQFDPTCPQCGGSGDVDNGTDVMLLCDLCGGAGEATSMGQVMAFLRYTHKPVAMWPIGMIDHSGLSFFVGHGAERDRWDGGTCGFLILTQAMLDEWGTVLPDDEMERRKQLDEWAAAEIAQYEAWQSGDVWTILDLWYDGEGDLTDDDSPHGLIGGEYAESELAALRLHISTQRESQ